MAEEAAPIIGRTLAGKFRVTGVIGEGGMATVYRALQDAEPTDVAIKVMNPDLAKDSRFVRRFRREAKAASMLKHPNTVNILEFGVDDGFVFLAMECVEGSDLALLLHRERRVSEVRAANIVMQVCRALSAAHELSIVHRDLKPDNIMVLKKAADAPANLETVKVLDFGIAKILDEDAEGAAVDPRAEPVTAAKSLLTRVGTIVGTPAYMAPEQGRAEPVDGRTDVYACGVLLYELVTGRVPFSGETPMQVVMRHVNEPALPPSTFIPVHPDLEATIMKALEKWPAQRQQTAAELAAELNRLLPHLAATKRQAGEAPPSKIIVGPAATPPAENDASTLVIEGKVKTGAQQAPAFPTLNIDVPEDLMAGIEAKPPAPVPAAGMPPPGMPYPMPKPAPPPPLEEPDADSDDVRTLIAREAPGGVLTAPAKNPPLATADRSASIPDLSTPIAFAGSMGAAPSAAKPGKPPPPRPSSPQAAPPVIQPLEPSSDKITTLVSAVPDEIKTSKKPSEAQPGTTPIAPIKGTAKSDHIDVDVPIAGAPATVVPTTQPSAAAGAPASPAAAAPKPAAPAPKPPSIALDVTHRVEGAPAHLSTPPPPPAPPPSRLDDAGGGDPKPIDLATTPAPGSDLKPPAAPEAPGSVAVWEPPPRKRLSGPMAMVLGIVIGALLFGLALLIMKGNIF